MSENLLLWRTKGEYGTLSSVVLRTCTVAVKDLRDVEHSIEVNAETLYEAIATALAALQQDNWVGEVGQGFTTVTVVVQQPPVKHEVKMKDFLSWLGRQGRSPAEVILKQKLEKIMVRTLPCHRLPTHNRSVFAVSSQSTPLTRQFSLTFGTSSSRAGRW
jgi:hypothetical protein